MFDLESLLECLLERVFRHAEPLLLGHHLEEFVELDRVIDLVLRNIPHHLEKVLFYN